MLGGMAPTAVRAQAIWVTEHYWPGLTDELVLAQAERLSRLPECRTTVVLPGQQTAFGFFDAATDDGRPGAWPGSGSPPPR